MAIGELMHKILGVIAHDWVIQIFITILVTTIFHYVWRITYNRLLPRFQNTKNIWDEILMRSLRRPVFLLIWVLGLSLAAQIIVKVDPSNSLFSAIAPLRKVGIITAAAWFLVRMISVGEKKLVEAHPKREKLDKTTVMAITKVLHITVMVTAVLVTLQTLGIGISGFLAAGGIGGAAVAFASKDLLSNFFGGLVVYTDKPFAVGDWIRSPDKSIEGTVEYIGWRSTRIRTFDMRPLYVPNAAFTTIAVENPSRMTNRRIKTNIGLRYNDATKMRDVLTAIEVMLREHPEIETNLTLMVNLIDFGPSSLDFMVYTFTKTTNWVKFQAIQQDVFLKIIDIVHAHGAQCAFPTRTLHLPEGLNINHDNGSHNG